MIALGKLGGQELNYSSDIDLMFLYSGQRRNRWPAPITNKEFFKRAANELTALLSTYTAGGPVLPRRSAPAAGREPGRGVHFARRRAKLLRRRARAIGNCRC